MPKSKKRQKFGVFGTKVSLIMGTGTSRGFHRAGLVQNLLTPLLQTHQTHHSCRRRSPTLRKNGRPVNEQSLNIEGACVVYHVIHVSRWNRIHRLCITRYHVSHTTCIFYWCLMKVNFECFLRRLYCTEYTFAYLNDNRWARLSFKVKLKMNTCIYFGSDYVRLIVSV